jgi:hypothetical protein
VMVPLFRVMVILLWVEYRLLSHQGHHCLAMSPVSSPSTQVSILPVTWHWHPKITVGIHGSSARPQPRSATSTLFPLVIAFYLVLTSAFGATTVYL